MKHSLIAFALCGFMLSPPVNAQVAEPLAEEAGGIEEILVTARRRDESLQDAPLTMTAISEERIREYDITSLERIAATTPNLYVGRVSNGSGAQITMRGIGASSATSIGIEQSVAVILNGAYYGQGRVLNEGMFDLEQIEILKGPQSLYFGKNATAGVISLVTAGPTETFEVSLGAGYEFEAEQTRLDAVLSGPLGDRAGARLAVRYSDMDGGYFRNSSEDQPYQAVSPGFGAGGVLETIAPGNVSDTPAEEELLARLTLTFDPTDNLAFKFVGQMSDVEHINSAWNNIQFSCDNDTSLSGYPCGDNFETHHNWFPDLLAGSLPYARSDGELYNKYESYSLNLEINYSFSNHDLLSITNYQENDNDWALPADFASIPNAVFATEHATWEAWSQELRLSSNFDGPLNYMLGLLYQETDRQFRQWVTFGGFANWNPGVDPSYEFVTYDKDSPTEGKTFSPFFELTWDVTDAVTVTAGARYTDESKDSVFSQPYVHPDGTIALGWIEGAVPAEQDFEEWSPEATISWQVNDEINLYAAYKSAYKSGGFSNGSILAVSTVPSDFTFDPETADGFEIGMKALFMDNQLRFNASLYSYEYDDLQLDYFNPTSITFITLNAGRASTDGAEIDLEYAPLAAPGLRVFGTLAYNKAEYDNFIAPCWEGQTPATGCDAVVPETNGAPGQDISGEATGMAPEWTASLGLNYNGTFNNGMGWGIGADMIYSDEYNSSALGHPFAWRDSFTLWNAFAYVSGAEDRWLLQLLGKNLTDELVISGMLEAAFSGAGRSQADLIGYAGVPRTVALRFEVNLR